MVDRSFAVGGPQVGNTLEPLQLVDNYVCFTILLKALCLTVCSA